MPHPYVAKHWDNFIKSIDDHKDQGPTGQKPSDWQNYGLEDVPQNLPDEQLNRDDVRAICRDIKRDVLFGYICAMAWGGQGMGPAGARHIKAAWSNRKQLKEHLEELRESNLERCDAYSLFLGENRIPGLGPAFWTKLLFFFGPDSSCYIMDQWTAKSVNLLTGLQVVRLEGNYVTPDNKCGNYRAFCEEIDRMVSILRERRKDVTGAKVEEWLFSQGKRDWRKYVRSHYPYDPEPLRARYRDIKEGCF